MSSAFSSADGAAIERTVDCTASTGTNSIDTLQLIDIWTADRLAECSAWICDHGYRAVCLQFPDELLPFSAHIAHELKTECQHKTDVTATSDVVSVIEVYILGDTSYGSCCVDEVAASHINADAIIHFGHACLSRVVRLPLLYVFHNRRLDAERFAQAVRQLASETERVYVFYNVGYYYQLDALKFALTSAALTNVHFAKLAIDTVADNLCWTLADDAGDLSTVPCVFIGADDQTLFNLTLSVPAQRWLHYEPGTSQLLAKTPATTAWMRRRNYCIERCKDASALGIVVGTLATRGYLDIVRHLQALARHRNVRTYLISVGKVNPAKLANFMEIDCFVLIGCAENDLFTSRDFYRPLLSVYEVEMALNAAWHGELAPPYSLAFGDVLPEGRLYRSYDGVEIQSSDVSLVTGRVRSVAPETTTTTGDAEDDVDASQALLLKRNHQLVGVKAGGALQDRTWTGLEAALGKTAAVRIEAGRSGIAMQYEENVHE